MLTDAQMQPFMPVINSKEPICGDKTPLEALQNGTPLSLMALDQLDRNYQALRRLENVQFYYAVKANHDPLVVGRIFQNMRADISSGQNGTACAEVANGNEAKHLLNCGLEDLSHVIFSNTAKTLSDVKFCLQNGMRKFVTDSSEDLDVITIAARQAGVDIHSIEIFGRVYPSEHYSAGAAMSERKNLCAGRFGISEEQTIKLLKSAHEKGFLVVGLTGHAGTQQTSPEAWNKLIASYAFIFNELKGEGINLNTINLGGAFPLLGEWKDCAVTSYSDYNLNIKRAITQEFVTRYGLGFPTIIAEPGRALVSAAGCVLGHVHQVKSDRVDPNHKVVTTSAGFYGTGCHPALSENLTLSESGALFGWLANREGKLCMENDDCGATASVYGGVTADLDVVTSTVDNVPKGLLETPNDFFTVVFGTGAYASTFRTYWTGLQQPMDIIIDGGKVVCVREPVPFPTFSVAEANYLSTDHSSKVMRHVGRVLNSMDVLLGDEDMKRYPNLATLFKFFIRIFRDGDMMDVVQSQAGAVDCSKLVGPKDSWADGYVPDVPLGAGVSLFQ